MDTIISSERRDIARDTSDDRVPLDIDLPRQSHRSRCLSALGEAARVFCDTARTRFNSDRARHNAAIAVLHNLMTKMEQALDAEVSPEDIRESVAEAVSIQLDSPFFQRVYSWPRGYSGDFETVEYICDALNKAPAGSFAQACESYFLSSAPACQHRNKIQYQARLLASVIARKPNARILVLAAGGGRDLLLARDTLLQSQATVVVNDMDADAIALCAARLAPLSSRLIQVPGNALEQTGTLSALGPFDLILCGGLMDYIPEPLLKRFMKTAYQRHLAPGGTLFFTNIAHGNPHRSWMEFCGNWRLIERTEESIRTMASHAGVPESAVHISRDQTNLALLIELTKQ